jgi:hypothetical protein
VDRPVKHPGKTPAQRRVLDQIGCGNHSPYMANITREKLLRDGLIVELSPLSVPFMGAIRMTVRQFEMPTNIHIQWCEAMSDECEGEVR